MSRSRERVAEIELSDHRDAFAATIEHLAPRVGDQLEHVLTYALVSAFWAFVVYVALAYALQ